MSKSLTVFDPNQVPAHIAAFFEDKSNDNIVDRSTVPTLAYGGKRWTITIAGEKTPLVKKDDDGDDVPLAIMRVIILDFAKERGRAYYEGAYDPAKVSAPLCWSDDGKKPHSSIETPQHKTCDGCPMAAKGSKITDNNKAGYACTQHRMLAVVPPTKLDVIPALRLKIAITSDWDKDNKENEAKDWYAFKQYIDYLRSRGIKNTAAVITKIKFDGGTDYPKLLFQAGGWVSPETLVRAVEISREEETQKLLGGSWTPAGADGKPVSKNVPADEDDEEGPTPAPAKKAKAQPTPVDDDDDDQPAPVKKAKAPVDDDDDEAPAPAPKPKAKAAPVDDDDDDVIPPSKSSVAADKAKPVAKAKAPVDDDDDDDVPAKPATADPKRAAKAAAAAAKAKPVVEDDDDEAPPTKPKGKAPKAVAEDAPIAKNVPKGVSDLLTEWDDD